MRTEYVVIDGACWPVNTLAQCGRAAAALSAAGIPSADVWVSPRGLAEIEADGDPDGYRTGQILWAAPSEASP